jgi:hypothetical protein
VVAGQNRRRARNRMVLAGTVPRGDAGLAAGSAWVITGGGAGHPGPGGRACGGPSADGPGPGAGPGWPAAASGRTSLPSWRAPSTALLMTARSWSDKITLSCAAMSPDPGRRDGRTRNGRPSAPVRAERAPVLSCVPGPPGAPRPGPALVPAFPGTGPGCSSRQLCARTRESPTG